MSHFLHVARVKKPTVMRDSRASNVQKRATKSDTSGHCLFIRADLANLNKKACVTSLPGPPRLYDRKRGNIYCNWMYRHRLSTNTLGYKQYTTLLCPLVESCGCPCDVKIEETSGQIILYIPEEHSAAD